ncbi:MAG: ABC transporter ATP-binding protein [Lachnospiraceae bacterium]|nr:ABC transporter ATP-binding protein [Lachnospiraceae bacterium]
MKLILENVEKSFDEKQVIKGASFEFESGNIYGLLGRNGAGKTTLFNVINEDLTLDSGSVKLSDEGGERAIDSDDIGYVLSTPIVPDFLTGRELIKFFKDINMKKIPDMKSEDEYFDMVDIAVEDRDRLIKDYSHGMKNKMMMLLTIISNPAIWLLDEPLTSFDVVVADEMKELLKKLKRDRLIIFSTHIMELALSLCDKIVLLKDGKLRLLEQGEMSREEFEAYIIKVLKDETEGE